MIIIYLSWRCNVLPPSLFKANLFTATQKRVCIFNMQPVEQAIFVPANSYLCPANTFKLTMIVLPNVLLGSLKLVLYLSESKVISQHSVSSFIRVIKEKKVRRCCGCLPFYLKWEKGLVRSNADGRNCFECHFCQRLHIYVIRIIKQGLRKNWLLNSTGWRR